MLHIKSFTFNPFEENTYLIYDESGEATLIDPGCYEVEEQLDLLDFITEKKLKVTQLINTHCHVDHVLGNFWAKKTFSLPLGIHQNEVPVLKSVEVYGPNYGFNNYQSTEADYFLKEGEQLKVGKESLEILFVPGHAPGHLVFYHKPSHQAIVGDTIFRGSIGRTDLPGGNHQLLLTKIKSELLTLPDETVLFPGHGPSTTVAFEKASNPFVGKSATT
jgi:glyoxylase-like metal-dependent hydrolase (beta-lactamase superfamily II)